jgi:hypothetical protein
MGQRDAGAVRDSAQLNSTISSFRSKIDEMDSRLGFASFVNRGANILSQPRPSGQKK